MEEIWKDIEGYEGLYQVSNLGRVKSLDRVSIDRDGRPHPIKERILKQSIGGGNGFYWIVSLSKYNVKTTFLVHILVAKAFIPNPNCLPMVMHKDEKNLKFDNVCNNNAENLCWGTCKENLSQAVFKERSAISHSLVRGERHWRSKPVECEGVVYPSITSCGQHYNIPKPTMYGWLSGLYPMPKKWQDMGLKYADKQSYTIERTKLVYSNE